ncbi:major facilitator superfamily domain-containing protein [Daedaleopsis nitida]|nr:major facilitator superfamily domain-containing protein [Daedaleopsis nitida]
MAALHHIFFVLSVCGVTILNIFVTGALIIALPTIGRALHFDESELQWPLNVYALSYGSLLLLFGRVADVVGSKPMFLFGTGFFTVWSIATGLAPNKLSLIVFVALTGLGAAANTPTGIGIFANHFKPGPTRNRAIAAMGAGQAIGYIVGLVGGGFFCQSEELWRVIFFIQGGLAAVFFVLGIITIPPDISRARYTKGIDWIGAILSVVGVGLLTFVLSESTAVPKGWKTPWVPALLVVSVVILVLFVVWEGYREHRDHSVIMPISLWTKPGTRMGAIVAVVFLGWGSYNCLSYFATLYYQQIRGDSTVRTSLELLPSAIMSFATNVAAGWLLGIVRGDILIGIGLLGGMIAPLIFALIDIHASYWSMAFPIMLFVAWTDAAYTVGNLQISISFDSDSQGLAGGIFNVATRLGTSIALALSSSVANAVSQRYHEQHPDLPPTSVEVLMVGFRAAGWVSFALAAAAFAVCVVGVRGIGVIGSKSAANDGVSYHPDARACAERPDKVDTGAGQETKTAPVEDPHHSSTFDGSEVVVLPAIRLSTAEAATPSACESRHSSGL